MLNNIILVPVMDINFSFNTATTSNQLPSNANPIIEFSNSFSSAMMHTGKFIFGIILEKFKITKL